ncbi:hypothetical protein ANANG_G00310210, partial [Anguilla anguilla]
MAPFGKKFLKARLKNRSEGRDGEPGKEIQVWVRREEKTVCGLTKHTTCAEVVQALLEDRASRPPDAGGAAPAEYCLLERWKGFERALPPHPNPAPLDRLGGRAALRAVCAGERARLWASNRGVAAAATTAVAAGVEGRGPGPGAVRQVPAGGQAEEDGEEGLPEAGEDAGAGAGDLARGRRGVRRPGPADHLPGPRPPGAGPQDAGAGPGDRARRVGLGAALETP